MARFFSMVTCGVRSISMAAHKITSLKNVVPAGVQSILHKLRYTMFIVLYPLGGVGECWTMINAMRVAEDLDMKAELWDPFLPRLPITPFVRWVYLPVFAFGFAYLYRHMLRQRSRKLKHE